MNEYHNILISFKGKIYSKQGSHISFVWDMDLVSFPHAGAQPEIFQGMGDFVEIGHFDKHLVKNKRTEGSTGKNFGIFSARYC